MLQEPSRVGDESEREPIDVLEVFEASCDLLQLQLWKQAP